jgi:hypothetical protein
MKLVLTIIMMNSVMHNFEYKIDRYNAYLCDAAFKDLTYSRISKNYKGRKQMATFYKSKEVFAYSCEVKR